MGPSVAELCVKHIGIVLAAYILLLYSLDEKRSDRRKAAGLAAAVLIGTFTGCIYDLLPVGCVLIMLLLFYLLVGAVMKVNRRQMLTLTIVSFGLSYVLILAATLVFVVALFLNKTAVSGRFETSVDAWIHVVRYVTSFRGGLLTRGFIAGVQMCFLVLLLRMKRLRAGLSGLKRVEINDLIVFFCVVVLSLRVMHITSVFERTDAGAVMLIGLFIVVLLSFILYFWLKKEYRLMYTVRLRENELQLLEKSLDSKEAYHKELVKDNQRLGALIHRDNKLIPSVVMSVRQPPRDGDASFDESRTSEVIHSIDEISAERNAAVSEYTEHRHHIPSTGVSAVDTVLLYLYDRAASMGTELHVMIAAEDCVPSQGILRSEFIAVLADLCEYSYSACSGSDGEVKVQIGQDNGRLFLEIWDNGKKYDRKELKKAGRRRTASSDDGNGEKYRPVPLFRILRHSGADLEVNEFADNKSFTKSLRVTFPSGRVDE